MKVLVSGASGFIGAPLVAALRDRGDSVTRLTRSRASGDSIVWNPRAGELKASDIAGFDAVIHLAGESIMGWWTQSKRARIRDSRVAATQLLARTLLSLPQERRPQTFISASAIGYYGDRGNELLPEDAGRGSGWLPEMCEEWENASAPLADAGLRVVWMRLGIVLDPSGGALKQMLTPFKLGLGATLGPGYQWFSWISLRDLIAAFIYTLDQPTLSAAVNAVAPGAVTNKDFTKQLAAAVHRPAFLQAPATLLNLLPGEMAEEALIASARVVPANLEKAGFPFQDPGLTTVFNKL